MFTKKHQTEMKTQSQMSVEGKDILIYKIS